MKNILLSLIVLMAGTAFAQEKTKLAVMGVKAEEGVSQQLVAPVMEIISSEVDKLGKFKVINQADIRAMLEHIGNKQLLTCDETKCLTIIGGALGVDQLLAGSIGKVGGTYYINLKVIEIDKADVLTRITEKYKGDEDGLIDHVEKTVVKLFDEKRLFRKNLFKWSTVGAAAAGAGAGIYFHLRGNDIYNNDFQNAVGYDNAIKYQSEFEKQDLYRNISIAVTSALSSAAIYMFWKD